MREGGGDKRQETDIHIHMLISRQKLMENRDRGNYRESEAKTVTETDRDRELERERDSDRHKKV